MAWRDERPGAQPQRPRQPAIAPRGRVRERPDPPVSGRCRELFESGVARPPGPQDLESADLAKVVTYAAFALLPPSGFLPRQLRRNSEDVVIPFSTPMLARHRYQLNKTSQQVVKRMRPNGRVSIQQLDAEWHDDTLVAASHEMDRNPKRGSCQ